MAQGSDVTPLHRLDRSRRAVADMQPLVVLTGKQIRGIAAARQGKQVHLGLARLTHKIVCAVPEAA